MKFSLTFFVIFLSCKKNHIEQISLSELKAKVHNEVSNSFCPQLDLKSAEYLNKLFTVNGREKLFLSKINELFENHDVVALIYSDNGETQIDHLYLYDVESEKIKHYVQEYGKMSEERSNLREKVLLSEYFKNYIYVCTTLPSEISGSYLVSNIGGLRVKLISGKSIYDDLLAR